MGVDKETLFRAAQDDHSLGNLLVREGIITQFELGRLLAEFQGLTVEMLLGQFLIKKNIICEERLQLILNRQDALRNGGVDHKHVMIAIGIAERTRGRVDSCADELITSASCLAMKAGG